MAQVNDLREENIRIYTSLNITIQHYTNVEVENSCLRAQISQLVKRLSSLNEVLTGFLHRVNQSSSGLENPQNTELEAEKFHREFVKAGGETAKNYHSYTSNEQTKEPGILNSIEFGSPLSFWSDFGAPTERSIFDFFSSISFAGESTDLKALNQAGNIVVPTHGHETIQDDGTAEQNIGSRSPPMIQSSQIRGLMQPDYVNGWNLVSVLERKHGQEHVSTKENLCAGSLPTNVSSQIIVMQPHSSCERSIIAVDDINQENVVRIEQDAANGSRKQGKVRTLDTEYGISREVLEQHSGKKLADVADILGISRSTLKRTCRKHNIFRWPPCKAKTFMPAVNSQVSVQATQSHIEDARQRNQPMPDSLLEMYSASKQHTRPDATKGQENSSIMVKATYKDDIIKFPILLSSRKLDLEKEVAERINLSIGSFKIKYLDEDDDYVWVACDDDLRTCMSTIRSLGKITIKMLVV